MEGNLAAMSRSVSNRKKKVTFREQLNHCEKTGRRGNFHSNVIRSYFSFLVKQLKLSPPLYRSLKEKGVLTTDQIGQIELEDLAETKVAKLLEIVRNADGHVFKSFCSVLREMGFWYLAHTLQTATEEKDYTSCTGSSKKAHMEMDDWNSVKLSNPMPEPAYRNLKEDNIELSQKVEHTRKEYLQRIKELEEELASVSRERDTIVRERNITVIENQDLQNLNHELQELVIKLENSRLNMTPRYPGHSVNVLPVKQLVDGRTSLLFTFNQHRQMFD
ncbi:uncharacterized protein [Scyliorhinus torazame]|uniref:uncharacterized protein isoform X2 n=1 Tax=Scyliorhinus torazame TaxID=75743 RepID=UPI003B598B24